MAQLIREWVISCEKCIRELKINPQLTRPSLQNPNEHINAPEDAMEIDFSYRDYRHLVAMRTL